MNDFFESIIREARTPERADSMLALVEILSEDYEDDLYDVNNIVARYDSSADAIGEIETLIIHCASDLLTKLGITVPVQHIYTRPDFAHDVIATILEGVDDYADYEGMLLQMDSDNPPIIAVSDLISLVQSKPSSNYVDYIVAVEERTIAAIRRSLTVRNMADYDSEMDIDPERGAIAARIVALYPHTPLTEIFAMGGYNLDFDEMVEKAELNPIEFGAALVDTIAIVTAGICAVTMKEYDYAYGQLHHCADLLISEADLVGHDINVMQVTTRADKALKNIFNAGTSDE